MKIRSILWELAPLLPVATTALFCWLWLAQVVPAQDSAEWITALATVAALVAAGVAAMAALGQLRILRQDAEARFLDERMSQARRVFLIEHPPYKDGDVVKPGTLVLHNNSTEPVENVDFHLQTPGKATEIISLYTLAPTGPEGMAVPEIAACIADEAGPWLWKKVKRRNGEAVWGAHPYHLRMIFRDSAGRTWIRRQSRSLTEVAGDLSKHLPTKPLTMDDL